MFGSQVLEVAIGLAVVFFILALASSAIAELISQILSKRSKDLRKAIGRIVAGSSKNLSKRPEEGSNEALATDFVEKLYRTSPISSLVASAKRDPSYIAASAFGQGVMEYIGSGELEDQIAALPSGLRSRVETAYAAAEGEVQKVQAELESWFDQSMDRLSGVYKRWAGWVVLIATIAIVLAVNADTVNIATELWDAPTLRQAVVDAAAGVTDPSAENPPSISEVAEEVQGIEALGIPLLWECPEEGCGGFSEWASRVAESQPRRALGWIITILLVSLGAPFWYGALTQLVSMRSAGSKPPNADKDDTSVTALLLRQESAAQTPSVAITLPAEAEADVPALTTE